MELAEKTKDSPHYQNLINKEYLFYSHKFIATLKLKEKLNIISIPYYRNEHIWGIDDDTLMFFDRFATLTSKYKIWKGVFKSSIGM